MKPSEITTLIDSLLKAPALPAALYLEGAPGTGKTSLVFQAAKEHDLDVIFFHPVFWEPVDMRGIPAPYEKTAGDWRTRWCSPDYLPTNLQERGVCIIDELAQADPAMQKACAPICLEKRFGDRQLPPGWLVVATGNRTSDKSGAFRLLDHLRKRLVTVQVEISLDDFQTWGIKSEKIIPEVRHFLNYLPKHLGGTTDSADECCPRSWEQVSSFFAVTPSPLQQETFSGIVGAGPSAEFMAFCRVWQALPDMKELFAKPEKAKVPKELDVCYAVAGAVAEHMRVADDAGLAAGITYLERMPREFSMKGITQLVQAADGMSKRLLSIPKGRKWLQDNRELLTASYEEKQK
jgi:hypothetical protein